MLNAQVSMLAFRGTCSPNQLGLFLQVVVLAD